MVLSYSSQKKTKKKKQKDVRTNFICEPFKK